MLKQIIPSRPSPHLVLCRQFSVPKRETSFHFHLCINSQITDFVCRAGVGGRIEVDEGWDHKNLLEQKPRQTTRTYDAGQGTTVCWWISIKTLLKLFRLPMCIPTASFRCIVSTQHVWWSEGIIGGTCCSSDGHVGDPCLKIPSRAMKIPIHNRVGALHFDFWAHIEVLWLGELWIIRWR